MIPLERMESMLLDLASDSDMEPPEDLDSEDLEFWKRLRDAVQEIEDRGGGIEIPHVDFP